MYVVIRKIRGMRNVEEAARRAAEGVGAILKQTPGFRGYYLFDDGQGGGSVTLFDSREAAEAGNEEAIAWIKANLADFYDGAPPEVTKGEVLATVTG
jgi:heme-degrading monooxygenase HmoA